MSVIEKMAIGKTVNFQLYPAAILGSGYSRVKVVGILDADTARHWIDPVALHVNVYPTLPAGIPNNYNEYLYAKIKLPNGTFTCVGLPWIREESIEEITSQTMVITIEDVAVNQQQVIIDALSANGITVNKVEYK